MARTSKPTRIWPAIAGVTIAVALTTVGSPVRAQGDEMTMQFLDTPFPQAMAVLQLAQPGFDYVIGEGLERAMVTLSLEDVPFQVALRIVLESVGAIYTLDGGVYRIRKEPRRDALRPLPAPAEIRQELPAPTRTVVPVETPVQYPQPATRPTAERSAAPRRDEAAYRARLLAEYSLSLRMQPVYDRGISPYARAYGGYTAYGGYMPDAGYVPYGWSGGYGDYGVIRAGSGLQYSESPGAYARRAGFTGPRRFMRFGGWGY